MELDRGHDQLEKKLRENPEDGKLLIFVVRFLRKIMLFDLSLHPQFYYICGLKR